MMAQQGERKRFGAAHHMAIVTDATVRVMRALRERHGWTYTRIGEVYDQPWRSVVNYCAYITRSSAGQPGDTDNAEADRIEAAYREAIGEAHSILAQRLMASVTGKKLER